LKTTIAPEVLLTIARLTAKKVPGVSRLCAVPGGIDRLFKKNTQQGDGICIEITEDTVFIDIYVALQNDVIVREVSRKERAARHHRNGDAGWPRNIRRRYRLS
jgi:uncharacterized alkaline shock family protein YloU